MSIFYDNTLIKKFEFPGVEDFYTVRAELPKSATSGEIRFEYSCFSQHEQKFGVLFRAIKQIRAK